MRHSYQQTLRDKGEKENSYTLVLKKGNATLLSPPSPERLAMISHSSPAFSLPAPTRPAGILLASPGPPMQEVPSGCARKSKNFLSLEPVDASIIRRVLFGKVLVQLV